MESPHEWSFRAVAADGSGGALFVVGRDDLTEQNVPLSFAFKWRDGWSKIDIPFIANGVCAGTRMGEIGVIAGVYGYALRWTADGVSEGRIDAGESGPQYEGDITDIRRIENVLFVVGMGRTVYVDRGTGVWERIDHTVRASEDDEEDPGFTSVDGFSETDVYAVGWEGEIWRYDGQRWIPCSSPTDVTLQRVVCANTGVVYACGQSGTVVRGANHSWEVVASGTDDTFWGAAWFKEQLYLATLDGLFLLNDNTVEPLQMKLAPGIELPPDSFYRLDADRERLWSMGRRKILVTEDGANWREVPQP